MATFVEIFEQIPKRPPEPTERSKFIRKVADACKCSEHTVRMWVSGRQRPTPLTQSVLAKLLKTPAEELFPEKIETL